MNLKFSEPVSRALVELKFHDLTEVQEQAIPLILQGEDLVIQSRTGTGKTAAFAIPLLENAWNKPIVQAIILVPTRELAIQVGADFRKIGKYAPARVLVAYGGTGIERQIDMLRAGVQIVVGTPGRVMDLMERGVLNLSKVQFVVLDEADVMLNMGFIRDVEKILSVTPEKKQVMLICVDLPDEIVDLAKRYLRYPQHVKLVSEDISAEGVTQYFYLVPSGRKLGTLLYLLNELKPSKSLIFCRTKRSVAQLERLLNANGIRSGGLQGNLTQSRRDAIMRDFKDGRINVLVATDLASRGIHVEHISHVFNYELPYDINNYVHRIGRTGRMHAVGEAVALVYSPEMGTLGQIERLIGKQLEEKQLPANIPAPKVVSGFRESSFDSGPRGRGRGFSGGSGRRSFGGPRRPGSGGGFRERRSGGGSSSGPGYSSSSRPRVRPHGYHH